MAWLGEELPAQEQDGRTPFAPRCMKDAIEERLFEHRRDLLTRLDLVFMDTTSLYFEGAGGQTLGRHGYSKDHRPDLAALATSLRPSGGGGADSATTRAPAAHPGGVGGVRAACAAPAGAPSDPGVRRNPAGAGFPGRAGGVRRTRLRRYPIAGVARR